MKLTKSYLTKSRCYKAGKKITVKGLMIHSVGCPQPKASAFINNWNKEEANACVHAIIDGNTGEVFQTLPWNHRGWHCGGSGNNTLIGVEMCEPSTIKYTSGSNFKDNDPAKTKEVVSRTYKSAVELFAFLCDQYDLDPLKDIIGHAEGHAKGIASNHGDPDHLWKKFGLSMSGFRADVKAAMNKGGVTTPPEKETAQKGSYKVKVTADGLNIRKGPGTKYGIAGVIKDKGVYTIVEENGIWGKLKSGAGWISLKYCKKL